MKLLQTTMRWNWPIASRPILTWLIVIVSPLLVYSFFLLSQHVNPLSIYREMLRTSFGDWYGFGEVAVRTAPFLLTALAAAIPARSGLVNVGAEGQLFIGALLSTAAGVYLLPNFSAWIGIPLMMLAGALGGALWGLLPAILRVYFHMNETITTLLLNYIAGFVVAYFVHGIMKDPASFNWPLSAPLPDSLRLPGIGGARINIGIFIAIGVALASWYIVKYTRAGFRMKVVGGNAKAAYQSGISVRRIQLASFIFAGAIAGIAGAIEIAGVEGNLRPTTGVGYGYIGFLAAWIAWNHPLWLIGTSLLLGVLSVAGISLELTSGLASSALNILIGLVLIAVLSAGRRRTT